MLDTTSGTVKFRSRRAMLVTPPDFPGTELQPATHRARRCVREHRFMESGTTRLGIRGLIFTIKEL